MRIRPFFQFVILLVLIWSCSAPKVLVVSDKQNAETATSVGNYAAAVQAWDQYFKKTKIEDIAGSDFASAAKVAFKSGNSDQSLNWFNEARYKNYSDIEMYQNLAEMARKQSNISKELTALEFIKENFSEQSNKVNTRLFEIYSEIKEPEKALDIWSSMDQNKKEEENNLLLYFKLKKSFNDTVVCDSVSKELLKINSNQVEALQWNASKYYWEGEKRYQNAMGKYNKNKTNTQYRILLKELDNSTTDFKKALTYLDKLWKMEPGKKYAGYFANIYARFGDEDKAKLYQKYLQ